MASVWSTLESGVRAARSSAIRRQWSSRSCCAQASRWRLLDVAGSPEVADRSSGTSTAAPAAASSSAPSVNQVHRTRIGPRLASCAGRVGSRWLGVAEWPA
ncbi:hypothetical protein [Phytohabitans suffuscus]|uniref:hypothetical protein n=1 Tax=Phytohabitans suffuscus TaxID=624315 RepID=UPI001564C15A|nr:hypothetical protein [Phytohabitans suffuscus]